MRTEDGMSVAESVQDNLDLLTTTERKVANALLANYPASGLAPVAEFAMRIGVSAPTVLRFVAKLGFQGYPDFQRRLRLELEARHASPLAKIPDSKPGTEGGTSLVERFSQSVEDNLTQTFRHLPIGEFRAVIELLCDTRRPVHLIGGRFTDAIARYFAAHLGVVRPRVSHLASRAGNWRDHLLDMGRRDVLIVFDVRRYQSDVVGFARAASKRGASVVLITDQWLSPAARHASHVLVGRISVPSRWDSNVTLLAIIEALMAEATEQLGDTARTRIAELEDLRQAEVETSE